MTGATMNTVYVYPFTCTAEELVQACSGWLNAPLYHWTASPARLNIGQGLPAQWQEQGAVFGPNGEVRWWQEVDGFEAVLLSDVRLPDREPSEDWEAEDTSILLQDLAESRVTPQFSRYPTGQPTGRLHARIYRCQGIIRLISPRAFSE